jgi:hypothetical protein
MEKIICKHRLLLSQTNTQTIDVMSAQTLVWQCEIHETKDERDVLSTFAISMNFYVGICNKTLFLVT